MSTSLSDLLTQTRDHIDETAASRWTDAKLRRYINQGLHQVQSQIQAANEDYFLRVETASAASGTYELAFPADIWGNKLRAVYFYDDRGTAASGTPYKVPPTSLEAVYDNLNVSGIPGGYAYHAGYIRWAPILTYQGTFRFVYALKETAFATDGTDDANNLGQIADEHADCIALYAGIMARQMVGAPTKELGDMYKLRMQQILNDVTPNDPITTSQVSIDD